MSWLWITIGAWVVTVGGHAVMGRVAAKMNPLTGFLLIGCNVGLLLAAILFATCATSWIAIASGLLLYAFLCELYIFSFTFVISSISVALLLQAKLGAGGGVKSPEDGSEMTARRVEGLIKTGLVARGPQGLRLTAKGAFLNRCNNFFRRLFGHGAR